MIIYDYVISCIKLCWVLSYILACGAVETRNWAESLPDFPYFHAMAACRRPQNIAH